MIMARYGGNIVELEPGLPAGDAPPTRGMVLTAMTPGGESREILGSTPSPRASTRRSNVTYEQHTAPARRALSTLRRAIKAKLDDGGDVICPHNASHDLSSELGGYYCYHCAEHYADPQRRRQGRPT
jgi:hypothetical protein